MCSYYIEGSKDKPIEMDENLAFVQVLDTSNVKKVGTSKLGQWQNIEKSINGILPKLKGKVSKYKIFHGNKTDFEGKEKARLLRFIEEYLAS
jgi:hypothetical protein